MAITLSPIRIIGFQIVTSCYEFKGADERASTVDTISFDFRENEPIRQDSGADRLEALLAVSALPPSGDAGVASVKVSARGVFEATYNANAGSEEEYRMFMRMNAFSLLYGFIRSHVQSLTSMTPSGQICLPCIDSNSIVEELTKEK